MNSWLLFTVTSHPSTQAAPRVTRFIFVDEPTCLNTIRELVNRCLSTGDQFALTHASQRQVERVRSLRDGDELARVNDALEGM